MSTQPAQRIAQIYPPDYRDALVCAAAAGDIATIDRLRDELTAQGYRRPRHDGSQFDSLCAALRQENLNA